jgi:hypothetical protein
VQTPSWKQLRPHRYIGFRVLWRSGRSSHGMKLGRSARVFVAGACKTLGLRRWASSLPWQTPSGIKKDETTAGWQRPPALACLHLHEICIGAATSLPTSAWPPTQDSRGARCQPAEKHGGPSAAIFTSVLKRRCGDFSPRSQTGNAEIIHL